MDFSILVAPGYSFFLDIGRGPLRPRSPGANITGVIAIVTCLGDTAYSNPNVV
jgi:hypothetical protein